MISNRRVIRVAIMVSVLSASFFLETAHGADPERLKKGEVVFATHQCPICHTIKGKGGTVGPDLSKVGQRRDEAGLKKFLPDPQSVAPSTIMPPFKGSPQELDDLVAYLQSLK